MCRVPEVFIHRARIGSKSIDSGDREGLAYVFPCARKAFRIVLDVLVRIRAIDRRFLCIGSGSFLDVQPRRFGNLDVLKALVNLVCQLLRRFDHSDCLIVCIDQTRINFCVKNVSNFQPFLFDTVEKPSGFGILSQNSLNCLFGETVICCKSFFSVLLYISRCLCRFCLCRFSSFVSSKRVILGLKSAEFFSLFLDREVFWKSPNPSKS